MFLAACILLIMAVAHGNGGDYMGAAFFSLIATACAVTGLIRAYLSSKP